MFALPGGGLASKPRSGFSPLSQTYSLAFAGVNQYMGLGKPADMNFTWASDSYSGLIWVYVDNLSAAQCWLGKGISSSANIGFFGGITTGGAPYLYLGGNFVQGADGTVTAGTWNCFQWTAAAGVGKFWCNGVRAGGDITIGAQTGSTADWLVMATRYADNTDFGFQVKGLCNMLAIWNTTLTPANVTALYNAGVPVSPTNISTGLIHLWTMGNNVGDLATTGVEVVDSIGSANGTLQNVHQGALWAKVPGSSVPTYAELEEDGSVDMHFRAADWSGSGNWAAAFGGFTGVFANGGGTSVKQDTSQFAGVKEITAGDWFRCADAAAHKLTPTSTVTIAYRFKPGANNGTGGFYMGFDPNGSNKTGLLLFNYFYAYDAGLWLYDNAPTKFEVIGSNNTDVNKYVTVHAVIDIAGGSAKLFVNGTYMATVGGWTPANFNGPSAPFGLLGAAYFTSGGYESTASGQTLMEVARYQEVFSPRKVATRTAAWNVLKGYY